MDHNERILTEAVKTYLQEKARLGVPTPADEFNLNSEHSLQHLQESINDSFAVRAAGLTNFDGVCRAFRKIHNYKYITDPNFKPAFHQEMRSCGVPGTEMTEALEILDKVIKEFSEDDGWNEQDAGFNPDLDEVLDTTRRYGLEE